MAMNWWVNVTAIAANLVTAFGIIGFAFVYFTHQQNQRQFKFTVMLSCIERFQRLYPLTRNDNEYIDRLKKYIDLTNEEFFYFQQGYIPVVVMVEWLDSILEFLPIYVEGNELPLNYNSLKFKEFHKDKLLDGYPRLKTCLTIKPSQQNLNKSEKIKIVAAKLGIRVKLRHLKAAMII